MHETPTEENRMPYGLPVDPTLYDQPHGPATIAALNVTAEGNVWRSAAHRIEAGHLNRVMPVMGVRLFYGRRADGAVVEFILTGRAFATAERRAREICELLWESGAFTGRTWEVYGERQTALLSIDLSPVETTRTALAYGRAMGLAR